MIRSKCGTLLRAAALPSNVSKRDFAQVGHIISTPPRVRCSLGEKCLHILFMHIVWLGPVAYFHTQIKCWRRYYIGDK